VVTNEMALAEAQQLGAMSLFGEKYGSAVRVVEMNGAWSRELCGGTHVTNTAMIGGFKILSETSVAAGIRRIEGVSGTNVLTLLDERNALIAETCDKLKVGNPADLPMRVTALNQELRDLRSQLEKIEARVANQKVDGLFKTSKEVDGIKIFTAYFGGTGAETLRSMCERVRDTVPASVTVLCGDNEGKGSMAVAVGREAIERGIKAGALAKLASAITGGNGGGKPDFAMAGVRDGNKVDEALAAVPQLVESLLN
ncbi:MAG: DHHA1 domain-containing protein, partial [Pygmaiobacter sp.]